MLLFVLAAVAVIVAVRWFAGRTGLPAAAILPVIGIVYALLPGQNLTLDPDIVLTFVLPPLLYSAALDASLLAIRRNLRIVVSLSVLLVFITALVIGYGFHFLVAGATLAAGIAVGATVAPPDPVAALAVGRRVGLPPRLVTIIQGEGLLNDATALTILSFAAAAVLGEGFSAPAAAGRFVVAAAGGAAVGAAVAYALRLLRPLTRDPMSANAVSLATPFGAYLLGEHLHVSGVLAVVVTGLVVGHHAPRTASGASRLQTSAVWRLVDFLLEGFVFLLIGQQLPAVIRGLRQYGTSTVVTAVAVSVGSVLLIRPLWLLLTQSLPRSLHSRLGTGQHEGRLSGREVTVLSWAGTRGVISLAAVFTLPRITPDRDLLLFCTFAVVLVTLVGQGLTFAPLVRLLGLRADQVDEARLRNEARAASVRAALDRLDDLDRERREDPGHRDADLDAADAEATDAMRDLLNQRLARYQGRIDLLQSAESPEMPVSPQYEAGVRIRRVAMEAQREELLRWRDSGTLPDEGLRVLERELDHEERLLPDRRK
ncbi:sodium:proton antiporter [Dactylosporangium aurantiacum]|uniref:Sodium:proton antiporter n=1 Tax=Dactylosporangium aurantiacum TaxID=35754 RepID=A0A9Q9MJX5_9ACTN|nr:sodium:proton antiporter [Dactylosporangium aurantiacum]MDG6109970.1 sodium:proton antiporter [Dactylosporangium aurantiacum]UWZ59544.1 sodium:proton antiporter [Dactylosporangium aurantiacum]